MWLQTVMSWKLGSLSLVEEDWGSYHIGVNILRRWNICDDDNHRERNWSGRHQGHVPLLEMNSPFGAFC